MSFERETFEGNLGTFGFKGRVLDLNAGDVPLGSEVKAIVLLSAGDVAYRPAGEEEGVIPFVGMAAGFIPPHVPGLVIASGTSATVATIED
ncbi:hypothetical protein FF124_14740 [Martelella lutilitoris]|uniref:Uncharacterized protein n=1 Tax=Martelella lutilitoris TaxID=2583532 RepID=A0A5C4JNQ6_9HYPH|nr:hypothetical protein [Martelella lutilitoris]TNB46812.1 hypothetical protein FF124_14740 [Martelella lutilitoris]